MAKISMFEQSVFEELTEALLNRKLLLIQSKGSLHISTSQ